jgi:hypothetical protein
MACLEMTTEVATVEESEGAVDTWEWALINRKMVATMLRAFPLRIE